MLIDPTPPPLWTDIWSNINTYHSILGGKHNMGMGTLVLNDRSISTSVCSHQPFSRAVYFHCPPPHVAPAPVYLIWGTSISSSSHSCSRSTAAAAAATAGAAAVADLRWVSMFAPPAGLVLFFLFSLSFLIYFVLVIFMYILNFNQQSLQREINELTPMKEHQNM